MIMKILHFDRFGHSVNWPVKVRNVSRLGSHRYFQQVTRFCGEVGTNRERLKTPNALIRLGFDSEQGFENVIVKDSGADSRLSPGYAMIGYTAEQPPCASSAHQTD